MAEKLKIYDSNASKTLSVNKLIDLFSDQLKGTEGLNNDQFNNMVK